MSNHYRENWQRKKILNAQTHQNKAFETVNELVFKNRRGKQITLIDGRLLTEFLSCSYLGLDMDKRVIASGSKNLKKCGVTFSSARTRMKAESFDILEKKLNRIFCNGYSTIFQCLHVGHLGFLPLLGSGELPSYPITDLGPVFILDKTVHASIQINRALLSQFGEVLLIPFKQTKQLEHAFKTVVQSGKTPVGIADGVGSMGGLANIELLIHLAEKYDGYLYLDDAHGTSVYGRYGCGYVLETLNGQFHPRVALATSLAKAFGSVAGIIVLPTQADADMMKRFATTYMFGGPNPLSIIDSAIASADIHLSGEVHQLQEKLWENTRFFDKLMKKSKERIVNYALLSPIRGLKIGEEFKAIDFAQQLNKQGYAVTTAMYPTVAKGESMLRIAISAAHTKKDISGLCKTITAIISQN